ncbi:MAG: OadG family protein [Anaerolineae bacterium]|nr:OadG family protein [Anaerolineae bacterium]
MNPILQGLYVSAVGIVVLFITATIFYFVIVGLQRIFPEKADTEAAAELASEPIALTETSSEDDEIAAVIAVAIQHVRLRTQSGLGTALQQGRGSWWSANLLEAVKETRMKK